MQQRTLQKFKTCLWYEGNAEEAMKFYASVFPNAKLGSIAHYAEAGKEVHRMPVGSVMTVELSIEDQALLGLNGGPIFKINPAISFYVSCKTEKEVEDLYKKLSEGGQVLMELNEYPFSKKYAWVNDKFGVPWQLNYTDKTTQKVSNCLMFTGKQAGRANEAIEFYTSIFKNSKLDYIVKYEEGEPCPGTVKHAAFKLEGQQFIVMDSPIEHGFEFTPATSFIINCNTQDEVDQMWEALVADGGAPSQCGWLTDKFGVSWQVVPSCVEQMLTDKNNEKRERALGAIMEMTKINIAELEKAYNG
ncbi:MAG: VOC family protein [Candidatus Obscuribacterales bacterium]|nr:VOC family protein [Candidatus Obscuribacterales bacterium]